MPASRSQSQPQGGRREGGTGALPNLVVIGAQKCGTSALHQYLRRHPEIRMSRPKEVNFFIEERNWGRGVDWYRERFDERGRVRGESSPDYTAHPYYAGVPERMRSVVPGARLIYLVRDPIDRIVAQWIHNYANGVQHLPLAEAVREPGSTYVPRSRYAEQLERFLAVFPRESFLILDQGELLSDRRGSLRRVFEFLEVDESHWDPRYEELRHESAGRRRGTRLLPLAERLPRSLRSRARESRPFSTPVRAPEVDGDLREELTGLLAADTQRFRELTGMAFAHWSV
jgi:hypothetical protein